MEFDLDRRTAQLSVGELSNFTVGPRDGGDGTVGIWRAQLGSHWHRQMEAQTRSESDRAAFEVPITGDVFERGWTLQITGRIDQVLPLEETTVLREIKTLTRPVPVPESELRTEYPHYFAQLAIYLSLRRLADPSETLRGELVFVETATGLSQTIILPREDEGLFQIRLSRIIQFLDQHCEARRRRRRLIIAPAFTNLRPGQEDTRERLDAALADNPIVAFEASTGFGKTGVMLESALHALQSGRCDRLVYLTSKSTGQLQVVDTISRMTNPVKRPAPESAIDPEQGEVPLAIWHVRNKREHCINHEFRCTRESCRFINDVAARWPGSGLDRFHVFPGPTPTVGELQTAGRDAAICPYEITRTALAFQDVWIGDYNYVFAPRNRPLFADQPGWNPARTFLIIDEAHNLGARVADAHSAHLNDRDLREVLAVLDQQRVSKNLIRQWESLTLLVAGIRAADAIDLATEEDLRSTLAAVADAVVEMPLNYDDMGPDLAEILWRPAQLVHWLDEHTFPRLLWAPEDGRLDFTCLDSAPVIGPILRQFTQVLLASATVGAPETAAAAWGLSEAPPHHLTAATPWRDHAYEVAVDLRVDTRYQQRSRHTPTSAATIARLVEAANQAVAVFFPSYRYAESVRQRVESDFPGVRVALQPRLPDLRAQTNWVEQSVALHDTLFLVLGSSFSEGIDLLGGRVSHAMVVGPALPEVNARQRAWQDELIRQNPDREAAFDRVYRQPGLQKVNQGLGRLVRAPEHRTRVLLHCQRFIDPAYARWLAPEYQLGTHISSCEDLESWLAQSK